MEEGRESKCNRSACQSTQNGEELIKFVSEQDSNGDSGAHHNCPGDIFEHLSPSGLFHFIVQDVFHDNIGWVQNQWIAEKQVNREKELYSVGDPTIWELICNERCCHFVAPSKYTELAEHDIDKCHSCDDSNNNLVVPVWILSNVLNRQDDSDALKSINREPDSIRVGLGVHKWNCVDLGCSVVNNLL